MTCKSVYRYICDNLDENLNSRRCREIRAHLKTCPGCTAYLESMKATVRLYRCLPEPPLPRSVHHRLMQRLQAVRAQTKAPGPRKRPRRIS